MGKILTIRLSAVTYNEEEVFRAWPRLCSLAWPGKGEISAQGWRPSVTLFPPPLAATQPNYGVLTLAKVLLEEQRFGSWPSELIRLLDPAIGGLAAAVNKLEDALANWQPQAANTETNAIEDALDTMERVLEQEKGILPKS